METIIEKIRKELKKNADEKTRIQGEKFFRENVRIYGLKSAQTEQISKEFYKNLPDKTKSKIFSLCEELWKSNYMEESMIACIWSYNVRKQYETADFKVFEEWVNKYITNWAACDTLCNHSVGTLIEMYPSFLSGLKKWAKSDNRWVKRASAVSLIVPARKGLFLVDIFEIADILHSDPDDMVQKGYGWMLKAASQAHQEDVFNYVMKRKATMPRRSLRYAIEKMPQELKARAMAI
ncbi:MAG: DNA alkylation repair protein [Bacteroidales bacterium]|jgi:3-methyladenine DNA glycosylase AlkD|nr:DNA alkylation repair protein [Bacteroidales bacterium]